MKEATILKTGIAGAIIAALCCATPALVILLGAVGLSAWLDWIDYVVLPALAIFLAVTAYGRWRQQCAAGRCAGRSRTRKDNH